MKKIVSILLLLTFVTTTVFALEAQRSKGAITKIPFPLINIATNTSYKSGATGFLIQASGWNDTAVPPNFTNIADQALTEFNATGVYYANLSAAEMNNDYVVLVANATTTQVQTILINTKPIRIAENTTTNLSAETVILNNANSNLTAAWANLTVANNTAKLINILLNATNTVLNNTNVNVSVVNTNTSQIPLNNINTSMIPLLNTNTSLIPLVATNTSVIPNLNVNMTATNGTATATNSTVQAMNVNLTANTATQEAENVNLTSVKTILNNANTNVTVINNTVGGIEAYGDINWKKGTSVY